MHAQHAQELRITRRIGAQPHEGQCARRAQHIYDGAQFPAGIARNDATTRINVRPLGILQQLQRLPDLARVPLLGRVVAAHFQFLRIAAPGGFLEGYVLGNIHHHRPGASAARNVEGPLDDRRNFLRRIDQEIVFDDGARDTHRIAFLEGILPDQAGRHLARNNHHRNAIHIGGGNTCDGIGQTRPRGDDRHAHLASGPCKSISGMHGRLLVSHQYVTDFFLLVQRIVDVEHGTARIAPDLIDAFGFKTLDQNFSPHQHGRVGSFGRSGCNGCSVLRNVHDKPLRISLKKNRGCPLAAPL